MNVKPGSTFIVSVDDTKVFDKNCLMYMVNCTSSGRYRITWLHVPARIHEPEWISFMDKTRFSFHRHPHQILEGHQSIYTIRRKDYGDLIGKLRVAGYKHVSGANIVLAVRRCVK